MSVTTGYQALNRHEIPKQGISKNIDPVGRVSESVTRHSVAKLLSCRVTLR